MSSPFQRQISGSFNEIYIAPFPAPKTFSQIFPAGGLTKDGLWVPLFLNPDGTLPIENTGGTPHFDDNALETDPGVLQNLIDVVVPANTTRTLYSAIVVTRVTGTFQVIAGGVVVGSGRTGPGGTGPMIWNPGRPIAAGTEYKIAFQSRSGSPPQDIEAYVQSLDVAT